MLGFFSKNRKGISPLIAAVLLIAFTMTIAAILATWAQTFGEEQLGEAAEEGRMAVECPRISATIDRARYDDGEIYDIILWNEAPDDMDLDAITFIIYDGDGTPHSFDDVSYDGDDEGPIPPGGFARLVAENDDLEEEPEELRVHVDSGRCPNVQPIDTCTPFDGVDFIC